MRLHPHAAERHLLAKIVTIVVLAILVMFLVTSAPGQAPFEPSPEKGLALAQRFCQGCHLVEGSTTGAVPAGILSFKGIANRKGQSAGRIVGALIRPHVPMPDLQLTNEEILHMVAYIDALRTDASNAPFLSPLPKLPPRPPYPKPS